MGKSRGGNSRLVEFSNNADKDRRGIYLYSLQAFGKVQAKRYSELIEKEVRHLANEPADAPFVFGLNRVRSQIVMQRGARRGHRIFYREIEGGILVLRIFSTDQDWRALLLA